MCLAIPGQILSITGEDTLMREGRINFAGIIKQVNLAYVPEAKCDDYVLVHAGFAIAIVDEAQARDTLAFLAEAVEEDLS